MHKIFGVKSDVEYIDRKGAYLVPFNGNKVGVVRTSKGYFLLGGGIDENETEEDCIIRECMEEIGYDVEVRSRICSAETYEKHPTLGYFHPIQAYYLGDLLKQRRSPIEKEHTLVWVEYEELRGKMYLEMQDWALEKCWKCKS